MLRSITNWSDLRELLEARGQAIYTCEDCGNIWVSDARESPVRCSRRNCRAFASGPKRERVGRPTNQQLAADKEERMKRERKAKVKLRKVWHDRNYRLQFGENVWHLDVAQWSEPGHPERGELRVYRVDGDLRNQAILDRAILRLAKHRNLCLICVPSDSESNATE